ncbi:MAG TPA: hypothetical protein VD970_19955 [Acetobacteraceae bacterium]|nr:hypothetical protein [Acetobacteraceae bacterium]
MADAGLLITEFLAERPKSMYLNIGVDDVALGLFSRVEDPDLIHQQESSLCGPAAFLKAVAEDMPDVYARYVINLFKTGRGRIGTLDVKPSADCRRGYYKGARIAPVDWIALASLRDSENLVLDYDSPTARPAASPCP